MTSRTVILKYREIQPGETWIKSVIKRGSNCPPCCTKNTHETGLKVLARLLLSRGLLSPPSLSLSFPLFPSCTISVSIHLSRFAIWGSGLYRSQFQIRSFPVTEGAPQPPRKIHLFGVLPVRPFVRPFVRLGRTQRDKRAQ